jgi:hypothetical protein
MFQEIARSLLVGNNQNSMHSKVNDKLEGLWRDGVFGTIAPEQQHFASFITRRRRPQVGSFANVTADEAFQKEPNAWKVK